MQSKKMSFAEALANTVLGVGIGFSILYFGAEMSVKKALGLNAIFIFTSTLRSYGLRRAFVWVGRRYG